MNQKEYNHIVEETSDGLFRFALRYTGDEDESNDAVQDCYVTLWEHHEEVLADKAKGYLMRMLYRRLIDRYRRRKRLVSSELIPERGYNPHNEYELNDSIERLRLLNPPVAHTLKEWQMESKGDIPAII